MLYARSGLRQDLAAQGRAVPEAPRARASAGLHPDPLESGWRPPGGPRYGGGADALRTSDGDASLPDRRPGTRSRGADPAPPLDRPDRPGARSVRGILHPLPRRPQDPWRVRRDDPQAHLRLTDGDPRGLQPPRGLPRRARRVPGRDPPPVRPLLSSPAPDAVRRRARRSHARSRGTGLPIRRPWSRRWSRSSTGSTSTRP